MKNKMVMPIIAVAMAVLVFGGCASKPKAGEIIYKPETVRLKDGSTPAVAEYIAGTPRPDLARLADGTMAEVYPVEETSGGKRIYIFNGRVCFRPKSFDIDPQQEAFLAEVLKNIEACAPEHPVFIEGYDDGTNEVGVAKTLSLHRAIAVKNWFLAHGVSGRKLVVYGLGASNAITRGKGDSTRLAANRRVEITVVRTDIAHKTASLNEK